jgi:hypothetical protein
MQCAVCDRELDVEWRPFEDVCSNCLPKIEADGWTEGKVVVAKNGIIFTPIKFTWKLKKSEISAH